MRRVCPVERRARSLPEVLRSFGGIVTGRDEPDDLVIDIVDCLEVGADLFRSPAARQQLVERFERRAGRRLYVPDLDIARSWCIAFVQQCLDLDYGLATLVDVVTELRPASMLVDRLLRRCDEHETAEVARAAGALWDQLRAELVAVPVGQVARAFRSASHWMQPPAHCANAWQLLVWTAGRLPPPGELPLYARFLARCAHVLTSTTYVRVEAWLRPMAYRLRRSHELRQEQLDAGIAPHRGSAVISLQFQPVGVSSDSEHAFLWWLCWADEPVPHVGGRQEARPGAFERIAAVAVDEAEGIAAEETFLDDPPALTLEIILPLAHIGVAAVCWRRSGDDPARFLIEDLALVVRPFDGGGWHGPTVLRQRRRWAALTRPEAAGILAVHAADLQSLQLARDSRIAAVVLSGPPVPGSWAAEQLRHALREGLTAIAWQHADPARPDDDRELIDLLVGGPEPAGLSEHRDPFRLPQRFREENLLRLEHKADDPPTAGADPAGPDEDIARRDRAVRRVATLLWNDLRRDVGWAAGKDGPPPGSPGSPNWTGRGQPTGGEPSEESR
ncbi:hypothetical protein [Parafrankia sp. EUN1f]|uniref:effector-associated domain 2-containing protein n=1 Tax=Parafrankia sp. EUN1f TaxID=102897 RepID=UPI00350FBFB8